MSAVWVQVGINEMHAGCIDICGGLIKCRLCWHVWGINEM